MIRAGPRAAPVGQLTRGGTTPRLPDRSRVNIRISVLDTRYQYRIPDTSRVSIRISVSDTRYIKGRYRDIGYPMLYPMHRRGSNTSPRSLAIGPRLRLHPTPRRPHLPALSGQTAGSPPASHAPHRHNLRPRTLVSTGPRVGPTLVRSHPLGTRGLPGRGVHSSCHPGTIISPHEL